MLGALLVYNVQYLAAGGTAYISCVQYLAAGGTAYTMYVLCTILSCCCIMYCKVCNVVLADNNNFPVNSEFTYRSPSHESIANSWLQS